MAKTKKSPINQLELEFSDIEKKVKTIVNRKKKTGEAKIKDNELALLKFKAILNQKPPSKFLKYNSFYGNKYIPIEILERMLSVLYISYSFKFSFQPVIAEGNIIFFMDIIVKNPITLEFETFPGNAAVPIMPLNGTKRDVHPHIPAAKSYSIMNGCKHIGRLFRAENDDITKVFDSYFEKKIESITETPEQKKKTIMKNRLIKMINHSKSLESLKKKYQDCLNLKDDEIIKIYNKKKKLLTKKK